MKTLPIPQVKQLPVIGKYLTLRHYLSDRLQLLEVLHKHYGDIFEVHIGPRKLIVISSSDHIHHVLQKNMKNYIKKINFDQFFGKSIFTTNNEEWKKQRDLLKPLFSINYLQNSLPMAQEIIKNNLLLYKKNPHNFADIRTFFTKVTFEIILKLIVGIDIAQKVKIIDDAITTITHYLTNDNYTILPMLKNLGKEHQEYLRSMEILDHEIFAIISETRKHPDGNSFIHFLLKSDSSLSDQFIRDNLITVIAAGYETTALTMSWLASLLAENPEWQDRCRNEAKLFAQQAATYSDLLNVTSIDACINETMRMYPAGWGFTRLAVVDDNLTPYKIQSGDVILICPYLTHRHPQLWNSPDQFLPQRFLNHEDKLLPRHTFIPFGAGPRTCLGMSMGLMEMKAMLIEILQSHQFVPSGPSPIPDARATIFSKNGFAISIIPH